jgi:hypothetical protein
MSKSPVKNKKSRNNNNHDNDTLRCIVCYNKVDLYEKHACIFRNTEKTFTEKT